MDKCSEMQRRLRQSVFVESELNRKTFNTSYFRKSNFQPFLIALLNSDKLIDKEKTSHGI